MMEFEYFGLHLNAPNIVFVSLEGQGEEGVKGWERMIYLFLVMFVSLRRNVKEFY